MGTEWDLVRDVLTILKKEGKQGQPIIPYVIRLRHYKKDAPMKAWEFDVRYVYILGMRDIVSETVLEGGSKFRNVGSAQPIRILNLGAESQTSMLGVSQVTHSITNSEFEQLQTSSSNFKEIRFTLKTKDGNTIDLSFDFMKILSSFKKQSDRAPQDVEKLFSPYYWHKHRIP